MATNRILIVGVGGLGVSALWALARAGARRLTLVDPDPVELSNLARQVIYRPLDIGLPKVEAAARWIAKRFPDVSVEQQAIALDSSNAPRLIAGHDFVIDATDSPVAKFLINDTCIAARTPFVYGGVVGMTGQAMSVIPGETACIRCVFEAPPDEDEIQSCREAGIVGPVAGAIGEMQAAEAMRAVRAQALLLSGKILTYDASGLSRVRMMEVSPRRECDCGAWKANRESQPSREQMERGER
ncbi:MAG TPA: HesA/MoeB/ThiF family protein [Patescibacteria group bacterium]|nr:HesA/MoeB/ThiF family protein [Patescibacteria group bacterium]